MHIVPRNRNKQCYKNKVLINVNYSDIHAIKSSKKYEFIEENKFKR